MERSQTALTADQTIAADRSSRTSGLMATGGALGAIASASCCVLPLVLFTLGASGPWIGKLTSLSPYQPIFVAMTIGFLGYGYWLVYLKPRRACAEDAVCAKPLANWLVKSGLWVSTALVLIAVSFNYIVPFFLT